VPLVLINSIMEPKDKLMQRHYWCMLQVIWSVPIY
jgi:hypothetical protein